MTIENKIRLENVPIQLKEETINELRIPNPEYLEALETGRSTYGLSHDIINFAVLPDESLLVPRGLRRWILGRAEEMGIECTVVDNRQLFKHTTLDCREIRYRPYQSKAIVALTTQPEGILVAPAGSGKTVMGLSIIPMIGQPTLWLTHTGPLAKQAAERARFFLKNVGEIGIIGEGEWKKGDMLTIGMVQTLIRNVEDLYKIRNDFGLLIADECHRWAARTFLEVTTQFNPFYMYGLTATPYRRDKLERLMYHALGMRKTVISKDEVAQHGGIIVPSVLVRDVLSESVNSNNIQMILRNYVEGNHKRNELITTDVVKEAKAGHFCIVISERRRHCETLHKLISRRWDKTGIATGKYTRKHVEEQVAAFNEERITVLVTTSSLLGEGFDVAFLDRAFLAMPFRAAGKTEQVVGRLQRFHPSKEDAMVYDYVDVNIGVLASQFYSQWKDCRMKTYRRLGMPIERGGE